VLEKPAKAVAPTKTKERRRHTGAGASGYCHSGSGGTGVRPSRRSNVGEQASAETIQRATQSETAAPGTGALRWQCRDARHRRSW